MDGSVYTYMYIYTLSHEKHRKTDRYRTYVCKCTCVHVLSRFSHVWFGNPMDCSLPGSSVHGDSPGKNTGAGCHALLQGISPIHGLSSCLLSLLHWQAGFLPTWEAQLFLCYIRDKSLISHSSYYLSSNNILTVHSYSLMPLVLVFL